MRKAIPLLVSFLLLSVWSGYSQQESATLHDADGVPMMDYGDSKPYTINDIKIFGVKYLDPDILTASSGLMRGETVYIPGNAISQAVSRLWNQRYFSDVKVIAELLPDDMVNIEIYLQERPRVYRWGFEGIRKGEANTLLEDLKLKRGSELSDYVIDKNIKLIQKHFSGKGFRNTEVTARIENDSVVQNAVNVTFVVNKNKRVKIGAINFEGNEVFTDKRLRRTLKKTHQVNPNIFQSFKLNETDYEEDKENLLDFYNSQGYRNAVIVRDSMYVINDKRIGIDIQIEEGDKFYIRNVSWVGNSQYSTELLQAMLGIEKGDTYDKKTLHKRLGIGRETDIEDMSQISSLYQNNGYLMSVIEPSEIVVGKDSIDLEIKVFEGRPFTINNVEISGNQRVDDEVIRREIYTRPGELYNRALLMQTLRQLSQMQHFDPASIMPQIQPVSNDLVDIGWPLVESASDKFEISGGWGAGMFVGSVGVQLNNLSVKNFFKKGAWRPYPMGQNQRLSISAQTNGTYYKALALSFTDPWLGGKKPNSFTISGHISEQNDAYYVWQNASRYFRTYGVAAGLGKRLTWPDPYFTFYAEASYERYSLKNWTGFVVENGNSNLLSLKLVLSRNSVDQPIYPRRGSEFTASVQATLPYSLWDGKDYNDPNMSDQDRYRWIEFHKWQFKAQWFQALSQNSNLVLMLKAEMGYLGSYNKNKVSPFNRYEVGGDGMSGYNIYGIDIIAMRGYEDGALDPSNYYSRGYNKYTAELRYPVILKPSSQIYVLGFLEGGNAFDSWKTFSPFKIKRAAGFGVRLYLPVVGMLGIDWGYGFDPPANSTEKSGSQFHFVMGQQF